MSLRILSAANVEHLINKLSLNELISETGKVFHLLSHEALSISNPLRSTVGLDAGGRLLTMAASVKQLGTSVKLVGIVPESRQPGLAATTVFLDGSSGVPRCILNARHLTALRTAAGSLLATRLLLLGARPPVTLALFGSGLQAQYHAELFLASFQSIRNCYILCRDRSSRSAQTLSARLNSRADPERQVVTTLVSEQDEDRISRILEADILCFATPSTVPLVDSSWVQPGAHVVLVGSYTPAMREVPAELIKRASKIVVDSREHALAEAGELSSTAADDLMELGKLVSAEGDGIAEEVAIAQKGNITIFKSVGLAIQDVMIASLLTRQAEALSVGTVIEEFD